MTTLYERHVFGEANSTTTRYIDAAGVRFAYRLFGKQATTPVVLFQRFRGTMDDWDPLFLDTLAAERQVLIFDNAGVGRSSGESPATIPGMAANAACFLDALGLSRADVLGWSMGGAVAQALTLESSSLVRRLIVAASGPGGVPRREPIPDIVMQTATKPQNDVDDFLFLFFHGTESRRAAGRRHLARLGQRVEPVSPPTRVETIRAMGAALHRWTSGEDAAYPRLAEITQPTLVANGIHDVMVRASDSFAMVERLPDAELMLYSDAGHGFLFQHAERFGEAVNRFLERRGDSLSSTMTSSIS
jgi:pimeloyl-ACP methyl ester carboxylesterase